MADGIAECVLGARNEQRIVGLEDNLTNAVNALQGVDTDQWNAINKLRDRLPVWAVLMMTALGSIAGATVTGILTLVF